MTLRSLKHSAGLVFTTRDHVGDEASFHVDGDGVTELAGWGYAGPVPDIWVNPPADLGALHVVTVELDADGDPDLGALHGIAELVHGHLERYAECRTWCVGVGAALANWVSSGCSLRTDVEDDGDDGGGAADDTEPPAPESPDPNPEPEPEPEPLDEIDALRAEYNELTGMSPDGRWGIPRLTDEVAKAKVQAAKDRAAAVRAGGGAETPKGTGSDGADT